LDLSIYPSFHSSIHLSTCLYVYMCICLSCCLPIYYSCVVTCKYDYCAILCRYRCAFG
jgi:hypothetical protein